MLRRWIGATLGFGRDCIGRFFDVQGLDRAMALAAQAFTLLLPLVVVYGAIVPNPEGEDFAHTLIDRFDLHGASAQSVEQAFATDSTIAGSVTALGVLLLIVSAMSFTRGLQRLFEGAYRLPALGVRGTKYGLQWLLVLAVIVSVKPVALTHVRGTVANGVLVIGFALLLWLMTPYLLMGKRLPWQRLLPVAAITATGMTVLTATSYIWLARSIESLSAQFGFMGVSFALVSWLFAAGSVLVASASVGAVIDERRDPP